MVASKRDAIAAIIGLNPTAKPTFLAEFSKDDLERYLDRLGRVIGCEDRGTPIDRGSPLCPDLSPGDSAWW